MFHFRLQTLLRLRLAERDQRRAELAKAIRAEEMLHGEVREVEQEQRETQERSQLLKSPGAADVDALLQTHRYEIVLVARHRQLATQIAQVEAETERRRLALIEADRNVRVLEKLRERQSGAFYKEAERRETKQLDEMAMIGFTRRREVLA